MPFDSGPPGQSYGLIVGVAISLAVLLLRNRRPHSLRIELLWVRPVIVLALMAFSAVVTPPPLTPLGIALLVGAGALGMMFGWQRGRLMLIQIDPETHALTSRASPLGIILILGVLILRVALARDFSASGTQMMISPIATADALLVFVVGMTSTQGLEMWLRARRLLAEARAVKAAGLTPTSSPPLVT